MKKIALITIIILINLTLLKAQPINVQSAYNYLKSGQLDKALEKIEPAITNEKTMNEAKTWTYRGNIYVQISASPKYKSLDTNAVQLAYDSYQKSIGLDKEKEFYQKNMIGLNACGEQFYNLGADYYNKKNFPRALMAFEKTIQINSLMGKVDTSATYHAALCADITKNKSKAKEYYNNLIKLNFNEPTIYVSLANIYKEEQDTTKTIKIIRNGKKKFPGNYDIVVAEANYYLSIGDNLKSQEALKKAVEVDPKNPIIHFVIGNNYEKIREFNEAELSYKKALELKPDYNDALYEIGALYVLIAKEILTEAKNLPLEKSKEYEILMGKANKLLQQALPYLEKTLKFDPKDKTVLSTLKEIYNNFKKSKNLDIVKKVLQDPVNNSTLLNELELSNLLSDFNLTGIIKDTEASKKQ